MRVSHCSKLNPLSVSYKSLPRHASKPINEEKIKLNNGNRNVIPECYKEAPSCTCMRGSFTIEAAVIFPLIASFLVCFLFFFRVMQVQMAVEESLVYAGRMTAVEYSAVEKKALGMASAEVFFRKELSKYPIVGKFVKGGSIGVSLAKSDFEKDYLELCAEYKMKVPVNLLAVKDVALVQRSFQRKWTGKTVGGEDFDPYVYVAETGSVYHTSASCHYIDLSIKAVEYSDIAGLRNLNGHKFSSCACAVAKHRKGAVVYVTNYGTSYHGSLGCSGLKRTIEMKRKSEVKGMGACSKCG